MAELKYQLMLNKERSWVPCYLKSEADKFIADLEESHKKEVRQLLILNREQANAANGLRDSMEQVIRHHKYKRCLAMAKYCYELAKHYRAEYDAEEGFGDCWLKWIRWAKKWHKRWLELAKAAGEVW